jgi:antitoxin VapB
MALNIRDPEAQQLARALAVATGETMTQAVIKALRGRLGRLRGGQALSRRQRAARLMAHGERVAALPVLDPRPPDELVGYDEVGLPR